MNIFYLLILCLTSSVALADIKSTGRPLSGGQNNLDANAGRFQAYGMNYMLGQATEDDEGSLEGHYSFRYTLYDCRRGEDKERHCKKNGRVQPAVFFSYTGEFDFYMGSRDSGPVINRTSNPALHLYLLLGKKTLGADYIDFGLQHRSNGQATEINEVNRRGQLNSQIAYERSDHRYFDTISRGSNYLSISAGTDNSESSWHWDATLKAYITDNSEVNWGPLAYTGISVKDYDIARFSISKKVPLNNACTNCAISEVIFLSEYTIGRKGFNTDSIELSMVLPIGGGKARARFPLMLKIHHGPMDTLSDYTKSVTSIGFGLSFVY